MMTISNPRRRAAVPSSLVLASGLLALGCTTAGDDEVPVEPMAEPQPQSGIVFPNLPEDTAMPALGPGGMPADFTEAERGGWKLGPQLSADMPAGPGAAQGSRANTCGSILTGVVRDLRESHPDFEGDITNLQRGLVESELGADGKPVLSGRSRQGFIQSAESFAQWYANAPGVNLAYSLALYLAPNDGKFSFESSDFFPLDGAGFGNEAPEHNFSFTFELHTRFRYHGGEVFQFSGDDDLWVFINGRLAIDLGGVHEAAEQSIRLDDAAARLGMVQGEEYALDFFQAERHASESNFQIETTLEFTNCGVVLR